MSTAMCCKISIMIRTQIQLPDELYRRAKQVAEERELSLAEMARRGLELFLARFPCQAVQPAAWQIPRIDGGGIRLPLANLRTIAADNEASRDSRSKSHRKR